ncbi:MAG: hypothetical protein AAB388_04560 [Patescibacteria group bacterium]
MSFGKPLDVNVLGDDDYLRLEAQMVHAEPCDAGVCESCPYHDPSHPFEKRGGILRIKCLQNPGVMTEAPSYPNHKACPDFKRPARKFSR